MNFLKAHRWLKLQMGSWQTSLFPPIDSSFSTILVSSSHKHVWKFLGKNFWVPLSLWVSWKSWLKVIFLIALPMVNFHSSLIVAWLWQLTQPEDSVQNHHSNKHRTDPPFHKRVSSCLPSGHVHCNNSCQPKSCEKTGRCHNTAQRWDICDCSKGWVEDCPVVYYFNFVLCLTGYLLITIITYDD